MSSVMQSKIEKAHRYATEPERVKFEKFQVHFTGENDDYTVLMDGSTFSCTCNFFEHQNQGTCCHIMALQKILTEMLSEEQRTAGAPFSFSTT